jgi:hypothetical protein
MSTSSGMSVAGVLWLGLGHLRGKMGDFADADRLYEVQKTN